MYDSNQMAASNIIVPDHLKPIVAFFSVFPRTASSILSLLRTLISQGVASNGISLLQSTQSILVDSFESVIPTRLIEDAVKRIVLTKHGGNDAVFKVLNEMSVEDMKSNTVKAAFESVSEIQESAVVASVHAIHEDIARAETSMKHAFLLLKSGLHAAIIVGLAELTAMLVSQLVGSTNSLALALRIAARLAAFFSIYIMIQGTRSLRLDPKELSLICGGYLIVTFVYLMVNIGDFTKVGSAFIAFITNTSENVSEYTFKVRPLDGTPAEESLAHVGSIDGDRSIVDEGPPAESPPKPSPPTPRAKRPAQKRRRSQRIIIELSDDDDKIVDVVERPKQRKRKRPQKRTTVQK